MSRFRTGLVASITLIVACRCTLALPEEVNEVKLSTFKGFKGVFVQIVGPGEDAERDGLTNAAIKTAVELRLRKAGIPIRKSPITGKDETGDTCWLAVGVQANKRADLGFYVMSVDIEVLQGVKLSRDESIRSQATTWREAMLGTIAVSKVRDIKDAVEELTDEFANIYLKANPK